MEENSRQFACMFKKKPTEEFSLNSLTLMSKNQKLEGQFKTEQIQVGNPQCRETINTT